MKIGEIVNESEDLTVDQIAQIQAQHGSPISNNVISRAKRIVSNKGISALDAIGMAQDIERKKSQADRDKSTTAPKDTTIRSPMTRKEVEPKSDQSDRVSSSGKKWGNQYYYDDKKKKTSGEKYKDMKNKIKSVARDVFKADDAELGADIGKDFTDFADKFMKSNIRKK